MERNDIQQQNLSERESAVLGAVVFEFITTGRPVGSRSFVQKYSFNISPATMRNIMYDLEALGFLQQPHTSAGRVPTDLGYRYYVNSVLDSYDLAMDHYRSIRENLLKREFELDKMFVSITRMLSEISNYAGVALTPKPDFTVVKHIELVPLSQNLVLVVLVTRTGLVLNKRIQISVTLNQDELHKFSKYLTTEMCGFSLHDIKSRSLAEQRKIMNPDSELQLALDILELALGENESQDVYIEGVEKILKIPDMIENEYLYPFLHMIEEKHQLNEILVNVMEEEGVTTLIGREIEYEDICGCSLITSPYKIGDKTVGVIGIIGPTRMNYKVAVPLVDYTGKVVSDLLTKLSK